MFDDKSKDLTKCDNEEEVIELVPIASDISLVNVAQQPVMTLPVQQIVVPLPPPNANDHEDKSHGQFLLAITDLLQSVLHKNNIQIEKLPNF